jgi:hypothetical protein
MSGPCDLHKCIQCSDVEPDVDFKIWTKRTTRGLRISIGYRSLSNVDFPANYARRLAKQLLDAADDVDKKTWNQRAKSEEEHMP